MASFEWLHTDARGLAAAIVAALARTTWTPTPTDAENESQVADLRALLVATTYTIDQFSTLAPELGPMGEATLVLGERLKAQFSSDERRSIARTLLETWRTLYVIDRKSNAPPTVEDVAGLGHFSTVGGGPVIPAIVPKEAGALPIAVAVVAVIGATIQAGVICYCADKAASVIDNELSRREVTKQMIISHENVLKVLAEHRAREEAAGGAEQPLTGAEKAAMAALISSQVASQKAAKTEIPSLFPDLKGKGGEIIDAAKSLGWGAIAIAAFLAYLLLAKGK